MCEPLNKCHGHLYNFNLYGNITQALKLLLMLTDFKFTIFLLWSDFCAATL